MEIKISLDEYADVPFIKKLLSQIKGINSIEVSENDKVDSWEETENSDEFKKIIKRSRSQIKNGEYQEYSKELMDSIFKKWWIIFSDIAIESLREITDFLSEHWTKKEIKLFKRDLDKLIESFQNRIVSYPTIDSDSELRFALLGKKQVKVYFDVKTDDVEILLFLPSKGNPENIERLFNK